MNDRRNIKRDINTNDDDDNDDHLRISASNISVNLDRFDDNCDDENPLLSRTGRRQNHTVATPLDTDGIGNDDTTEFFHASDSILSPLNRAFVTASGTNDDNNDIASSMTTTSTRMESFRWSTFKEKTTIVTVNNKSTQIGSLLIDNNISATSNDSDNNHNDRDVVNNRIVGKEENMDEEFYHDHNANANIIATSTSEADTVSSVGTASVICHSSLAQSSASFENRCIPNITADANNNANLTADDVIARISNKLAETSAVTIATVTNYSNNEQLIRRSGSDKDVDMTSSQYAGGFNTTSLVHSPSNKECTSTSFLSSKKNNTSTDRFLTIDTSPDLADATITMKGSTQTTIKDESETGYCRKDDNFTNNASSPSWQRIQHQRQKQLELVEKLNQLEKELFDSPHHHVTESNLELTNTNILPDDKHQCAAHHQGFHMSNNSTTTPSKSDDCCKGDVDDDERHGTIELIDAETNSNSKEYVDNDVAGRYGTSNRLGFLSASTATGTTIFIREQYAAASYGNTASTALQQVVPPPPIPEVIQTWPRSKSPTKKDIHSVFVPILDIDALSPTSSMQRQQHNDQLYQEDHEQEQVKNTVSQSTNTIFTEVATGILPSTDDANKFAPRNETTLTTLHSTVKFHNHDYEHQQVASPSAPTPECAAMSTLLSTTKQHLHNQVFDISGTTKDEDKFYDHNRKEGHTLEPDNTNDRMENDHHAVPMVVKNNQNRGCSDGKPTSFSKLPSDSGRVCNIKNINHRGTLFGREQQQDRVNANFLKHDIGTEQNHRQRNKNAKNPENIQSSSLSDQHHYRHHDNLHAGLVAVITDPNHSNCASVTPSKDCPLPTCNAVGLLEAQSYFLGKEMNSVDDDVNNTVKILPPVPTTPSATKACANITAASATPGTVGGAAVSTTWSTPNGGRLWRLAGEMVAKQQQQQQMKSNAKMWTQTLLVEHMRSCADVDALVPPPTPPRPAPSNQQDMLARLCEQDEEFLLHTGLFANKRVRVVQLLVIGLVGILFGWLGNFFVSSSCYFASIEVTVGEEADVFSLRFGLWNYSPVDSALNGYKYCYPYGGSHLGDAPIVSRIANIMALTLGTYSLVVLWLYLITGRSATFLWRGAVYGAVTAGICQLLTLYFYFGSMCRTKECAPGPGSMISIVTAFAWVILGAELHYNCPIVLSHPDVDEVLALSTSGSFAYSIREETPSPLMMSNLEMADIAGASNEFFDRFKKKRRGYKPPIIT